MTARPDQWTSHYNLGNYYLNRGEVKEALAAYGTALKIEPRAAMVMVNAAMAYAKLGAQDQAEKSLVEAIKIAPDNAAAHFNLGLIRAEQNRGKEAEREIREAFRLDPKMAPAAYNLCILSAKGRPKEALSWCEKAVELNPQEPKFAYTLAFYQKEQGDLRMPRRLCRIFSRGGPSLRMAIFFLPKFTYNRKIAPRPKRCSARPNRWRAFRLGIGTG